MALEQIPLEYQELVKLYFSQIKQAASGEDPDSGAAAGEGSDEEEPEE